MKAETKSPLKKNGAADSKLSGRIWFNICLFGFTGQMAWTLENMYFNTFLYNTVYEGGKVTGSLLVNDGNKAYGSIQCRNGGYYHIYNG